MYNSTCNLSTYLEWILSFKMKFIYKSKSATPIQSYDYQNSDLQTSILVRLYVFNHKENQSQITDVFISMEKSDQA